MKTIIKKFAESKFPLFVMALSTILVSWRGFDGEDIATSRYFYNSEFRNNFLSATGAFYYGSIPNSPLTWFHYLLIFQVGLTLIALIVIRTSLFPKLLLKQRIIFLGCAYLILNFASDYSRDGTMMAFIAFGFSLVTIGNSSISRSKMKYIRAFGWIFMIFGFSFRPWLSATLIFIYMFSQFNRRAVINRRPSKAISVAACFFLFIAPIFIDKAITIAASMQDSYPEQTVMIHDLSTTYCWSANNRTANIAKRGIEILANNPEALTTICQFYKPNTWQAVIGAVDSATPSTTGLETPIHLIQPGDSKAYEEVRRYWIQMILSDPFTYVQNHMAFGTQVIISGDTRRIRAVNEFNNLVKDLSLSNVLRFATALYLIPLDVILSFHLLSPLVVFLVWSVFIFRKILAREKDDSFTIQFIFLGLFTTWNLITTVGFISDNGRYTLVASFFLLLSMALPSESRQKKSTLISDSEIKIRK